MNCAFYDTSMKLGTNVEHIMTKIFGYRAISVFAVEGVGGHFPRWPPKHLEGQTKLTFTWHTPNRVNIK